MSHAQFSNCDLESPLFTLKWKAIPPPKLLQLPSYQQPRIGSRQVEWARGGAFLRKQLDLGDPRKAAAGPQGRRSVLRSFYPSYLLCSYITSSASAVRSSSWHSHPPSGSQLPTLACTETRLSLYSVFETFENNAA